MGYWGYCLLLASISNIHLVSTQHLAKDAAGTSLEMDCQTAEDCHQHTPNTNCSSGVCVCQKGFVPLKKSNVTICETNNTIHIESNEATNPPPHVPKATVDPKMIIIIVVLAIMFIGICVALHLFSKARFRNHRTIFNSPHPRLMHIKLGKKKGGRRGSQGSQEAAGSRQLSICSQVSPMQARRGSQAAANQENKRHVHSESANSKNTGRSNSTHNKGAQESNAKAKDNPSSMENADAIEPTVLQP